eukprot:gene14970-10708_t
MDVLHPTVKPTNALIPFKGEYTVFTSLNEGLRFVASYTYIRASPPLVVARRSHLPRRRLSASDIGQRKETPSGLRTIFNWPRQLSTRDVRICVVEHGFRLPAYSAGRGATARDGE